MNYIHRQTEIPSWERLDMLLPKSFSFCNSGTIKWLSQYDSLSESEEVTEEIVKWSQLELLHYKFSLKASRAHVVPNLPPAFHGCQRGNRATELKLLPRVEWTWAVCEVGVGAFEYRRPISPSLSPSIILVRYRHFQCAHGKWGI